MVAISQSHFQPLPERMEQLCTHMYLSILSCGPIRLMLMRKRLLRTHLPTKLITAAWVEEQRLGKGSYVTAQKQKARRTAQIVNNIVLLRDKVGMKAVKCVTLVWRRVTADMREQLLEKAGPGALYPLAPCLQRLTSFADCRPQ